MSQKRSGPGLFYLPAVAGVLVLAGAMTYCWMNKAGHSALDLREAWVLFGPVLVVGLGLLWRGECRVARVSIAVGILGIGFGYFAHHLGIMQKYNFWASNGLEPRNP